MIRLTFAERLQCRQPMLLDGGLATQLEAQGCDIGNALWSASLLLSDPQAIVDAHRAYLDAGAECITSASYQASRQGFAQRGLSATEADELMLLSVRLAEQARSGFLATGCDLEFEPLVAASIGPYGAILHDGSEYRGDYGVSAQTLRDFHAPRLALFDGSGADVLAIETIPSLAEAEVLAGLLAACQTPAWISFSCRDDTCISDGSTVAAAAALFRGHPTVMAVGLNCTPPQYAAQLIRRIRSAAPDKAIIAYPNSGEFYRADTNSWSGTATPEDCGDAALEWVASGASIVGGCCRIGPAQICAMRAALSRR